MLRPVDPVGVYNRWDWIRAGLEKTFKRTGAKMRPEDVYVRLRANTAWLFALQEEEDDFGFLILTQEHDPDGPVLFIWVLWTEPHKLYPVKQQFYAEVEEMARKTGAKRIRWQSPREYERERWGKKVAHVYEREV
jgi:hypothetical protein